MTPEFRAILDDINKAENYMGTEELVQELLKLHPLTSEEIGQARRIINRAYSLGHTSGYSAAQAGYERGKTMGVREERKRVNDLLDAHEVPEHTHYVIGCGGSTGKVIRHD